jgi:hypothetical protein
MSFYGFASAKQSEFKVKFSQVRFSAKVQIAFDLFSRKFSGHLCGFFRFYGCVKLLQPGTNLRCTQIHSNANRKGR